MSNTVSDKVDVFKQLLETDIKWQRTVVDLVKEQCERLVQKWQITFEDFWRDCILVTGSVAEGLLCCRMLRFPEKIIEKPWNMEAELDLMLIIATFKGKEYDQDRYMEPTATPGFYRVRKYISPEQFEEECFGTRFANPITKFNIERDYPELCTNDGRKYISANSIKNRAEQYGTLNTGAIPIPQVFAPLVLQLFESSRDSITCELVREVNGPAATSEFFVGDGHSRLFVLSVDAVPAIQLNHWPDRKARDNWLQRTRVWPPVELVKEIADDGGYIVAKQSKPGSVAAEHEWRLSFSLAEKKLAAARTHGQNLTYFVFKSVYYSAIKPITYVEEGETEPKSLPSYFAKTVMLFASEELLIDQWSVENVEKNVKMLLSVLVSSLKQNCLHHYFLPEINLVGPMPKELVRMAVVKIETIIDDPLQCITPDMLKELNQHVCCIQSVAPLVFRGVLMDMLQDYVSR